MSRKHCRRKHYVLLNPLEHVLSGIAVTPEDRLDKLRLAELSAIESFAKGKATRSDWMAIADLVNVSETLANDGVGRDEVLPVTQKVQEALGAAHERHKAGGNLGFDGPGLQATRELAELHDLQRSSISRGEYERAIKKTADRIRSAHPSVKVVIG